MLSLGSLSIELRGRMGNPTEGELPESSIADIINASLKVYNKIRPIREYVSFTVVADQDEYPVADNVIRVSDCLYAYDDSLYVYSDSFVENSNLPGTGMFADLSVFDNPSLWTLFKQQMEGIQRVSPSSWEWDPDRRVVRLIPPPGANGKGVLMAIKHRLLEEVLSEDEEAFKKLCLSEGLRVLVRTQRLNSVPSGIGQVQFDNRILLEEAKNLKGEAMHELGVKGSIIVVG